MSPVSTRQRPSLPPPPQRLMLPDIARGILSNGFEWIHVERGDLPLVDIQCVVRAGADLDAAASAGLASLTAELLEEGTFTRTGLEIAGGIDRIGAALHVHPAWDETTLSLHVLAPRLHAGLDILADVVRNASFPETEVRRRRDERLASLLQERDEPAALAARALSRAVYGPAHPYGRSARGVRATVGILERDALCALHHARYRPGTSFLVSVGAVPARSIERMVEEAFGGWSAPSMSLPAVPPAPVRAGLTLHVVDRPDAPQSELRIGRSGPPRVTPDHAALLVLNTVLGGAFTSRLNLKLREEKGFTYGARSSFAFRRGPGPFVAGAAVATRDTAEAVADALNEIRRLAEAPVPEAELERARSYLVLGVPRRLETAAAMAGQLADLHLHGLDLTELVTLPARVQAVRVDEVQASAREWLDVDRMSVVVAGDAAQVRGPLEALGHGDARIETVET